MADDLSLGAVDFHVVPAFGVSHLDDVGLLIATRHVCDSSGCPFGATRLYPPIMPRRPKPDPLPRCVAIRWQSGDQCIETAAIGAMYCPAHLALLPSQDWLDSGYIATLPDDLKPLAPAAGFRGVSEELAVARLHLAALLKKDPASPQVQGALHAIAKLTELHAHLETSALEAHMYGRRRERFLTEDPHWQLR